MEFSIPYEYILKTIVIAILVFVLVRFMFFTPKYKRVDEPFFGGVARGSGHPDCLRTLPEASELMDLFISSGVNKIPSGISDANADYKELELILSKLGCLKKDLMSPSGIPEATRYQAFETAHDRVPVAEVTGMCLSQNIPSRDLDIIFGTWRDRGQVLLRKLCTEAQLTEQQVTKTEVLFKKAWSDVYEIAKSRCLKTDFSLQNGGSTGGDTAPYEPEHLKDLRSYDFKYGGLSALGWNGNV